MLCKLMWKLFTQAPNVLRRPAFYSGLGALMFFACIAGAKAGNLSWTGEAPSPAINYAGRDVVVRYAATDDSKAEGGGKAFNGASSASGSPAPRITSVHARRSHPSDAQVQTVLCWNGTHRCVALVGAAMTTQEFNGLDASKPLYMLHRVKGQGPLASPLFVKGSVIVWFQE